MTAVVSAGLSVGSAWCAVVTVVASFTAGLLPGRPRTAVFALVAMLAVGVVAVCVVPVWLVLGERYIAVVVGAAMMPWFGGRFWRQYQELVRVGWERAEHLEREQQLVAEQARLRERNRIAHDMHDELGHELSLIALTAGALKLAPGLPEPYRARAQDIRVRAESAVDRLGEIVGVLREHGSLQAPDGVEGLVRAASAAGLPVTLQVDGDICGMPAAAYRVVQEGLTNAAKHAPGTPVTVHVAHSRTETHVVVKNDPGSERGPLPDVGSGGHGLIGLNERVRRAGGVLTYGPAGDDSGFTVEARLPHDVSRFTRPSVRHERRRVRRSVGRTLAVALMLPLMTAVLTGGVLRTWEMLETQRAVLTAEDYAVLRPGQARTELLLPPRQAPRRPPATDPGCEFYAMSTDLLNDRYGDTYRLCFAAGRLVSADALVAR